MKRQVGTDTRVNIQVRVDQDLAAAVRRRAAEEDRSVSWITKRALKEFIEAGEEATS